jgi:hypothetical protein
VRDRDDDAGVLQRSLEALVLKEQHEIAPKDDALLEVGERAVRAFGHCGLRIVDCGLEIADWRLRIGDCGLEIADCDRQSAIANQQSAIRNQQSAML